MAFSPKQIAARAVFKHLPKLIEDAKASCPEIDDARRKNPIKHQKASEMVDKILKPLIVKMERLCKRKLGKSVADEIDEADKADKADF